MCDEPSEKSRYTISPWKTPSVRHERASFAQAWQCPACGRLLVLGPEGTYQAFVPELPDAPRNVLAATRQAEPGAANGEMGAERAESEKPHEEGTA